MYFNATVVAVIFGYSKFYSKEIYGIVEILCGREIAQKNVIRNCIMFY